MAGTAAGALSWTPILHVSDLKIVLIHNRYQEAGGEDDVFLAEGSLLASRGHDVTTYTADNRNIVGMGQIQLAKATLWNSASYRDLRRICTGSRPVVAHFHNAFPLVSPAAYYGARAERAAVVQTLHNYRLICPSATLYRDGRPCEACIGKALPWPAVLHACYRQNRAATTVAASLLVGHRLMGTWRHAVDTYITLSEFARQKFVAGGLPVDKIIVKPNFLTRDPGPGTHTGQFGLFVGRVSPEKGIKVLLDAWNQLTSAIPLKIVGTGPLERSRTIRNVEWLGWLPPERVMQLMKDATFLILPSTTYEGSPMTLLQSFATGLPAIVSAHGSLAEIVEDRKTGYHFPAGDSARLAETIERAWAHPEERRDISGRARRQSCEAWYSGIDRSCPRNWRNLFSALE